MRYVQLWPPSLKSRRTCWCANVWMLCICTANCIPLLIQQNVNGSNFFNRSWAEFKIGFNDSRGNYWLGNDLLSQLTATNRYKLKFDLQSYRNHSSWYSAEYSAFTVLPEAYNYRLRVAGYSGNTGYDAFSDHNDQLFGTYDRDNDRWLAGNCAVSRGGGFWYTRCALCSVNGSRDRQRNFYWYGLAAGSWDLQTARMWLSCK